jgi:GrpB-like predicted nucleotidyltransferase (UPF0157 family)
MKGKIEIADYDPRWPELFEAERQRILEATNGLIIAIEHIGSTSVPGLAAKPVIDIMPGLRALSDAAQCIEPIVGLGYTYVPKYEQTMPERRYFYRYTDADNRHGYHIHLVEVGSEFWERHPLFRDYLRAQPGVAHAYAELKRELAPQFDDTNDYAKAKTDFIKSMEARAREWRAKHV